jgi:hypothetical protein
VWVTESAPSVVHEVGLVHLRALALNVAASLRALGLKPGKEVASRRGNQHKGCCR